MGQTLTSRSVCIRYSFRQLQSDPKTGLIASTWQGTLRWQWQRNSKTYNIVSYEFLWIHRTCDYAYYRMLFSSMVMARVIIRFSVWLVSGYVHVFILLPDVTDSLSHSHTTAKGRTKHRSNQILNPAVFNIKARRLHRYSSSRDPGRRRHLCWNVTKLFPAPIRQLFIGFWASSNMSVTTERATVTVLLFKVARETTINIIV